MAKESKESIVDIAALPGLVNPFLDKGNPLVDPSSPEFNQKEWLRTVMRVKSRDPERFPKRIAGVGYRDLSVDGSGEQTDYYQRTFGNYPLALLGATRKLVGTTRKTRVRILEGFDGLVKSGEMLLVLGRPGRQVSHMLDTKRLTTD